MDALAHRARACLALLTLLLVPAVDAQDAARVAVETVAPARIGERFSLSGTLTAARAARLSPRVDGLVAKVHVDAGDRVDAGDPLLELDPALAGHVLARARAASAEAAAALAEAERLHAEAQEVGARDFLPKTLVATRAAELEVARATLASARAAEREQQALRERHLLPAPFAGVIAERMAELGEWVQRGTPVFVLVADDRVRLDVQVPQERYAALGDDAELTVLPDALPGVRLPGRVEARVPVTDPGARTFLLRVLVDAGEQRLLPGTSARIEIALPAARPALAVSRDALLRQPDGGYRVFVVVDGAEGPVAAQRTVTVLRDAGDQVAISDGLAAGERVVVRGNEALRDGQPVVVTGG